MSKIVKVDAKKFLFDQFYAEIWGIYNLHATKESLVYIPIHPQMNFR